MEEERRFLAIDQGNTLIKLTLFVGDEAVESCRYAADATEDIFAAVERWHPHCGAFSSVGKLDSRMVESLRLALDGRLLILSRTTRLPISIDYATPTTLGLDRIAVAVAANKLCGSETVAVVDAGTAVTLDIVDAGGTFRGGRITAGLRLRFESLHAFTSSLPLESIDGNIPVIGDSTATSIRSGVVRGLADEITETFREYRDHYGCTRLLLTGGDSEVLSDCIKSRIPAGHVPDLMALGLLYIYKHNEI